MLKSLEKNEIDLILQYCHWRYGLSAELFSQFDWAKSSRNIYLLSPNALHNWMGYPLTKAGLRAFSGKTFPYRATTSFIQRFGKFAGHGYIEISQDQLEYLLTVGPLNINSLAQLPASYLPGPIILRVNEMNVGAGMILGDQLVSQISQGRVFQFLRSNIS